MCIEGKVGEEWEKDRSKVWHAEDEEDWWHGEEEVYEGGGDRASFFGSVCFFTLTLSLPFTLSACSIMARGERKCRGAEYTEPYSDERITPARELSSQKCATKMNSTYKYIFVCNVYQAFSSSRSINRRHPSFFSVSILSPVSRALSLSLSLSRFSSAFNAHFSKLFFSLKQTDEQSRTFSVSCRILPTYVYRFLPFSVDLYLYMRARGLSLLLSSCALFFSRIITSARASIFDSGNIEAMIYEFRDSKLRRHVAGARSFSSLALVGYIRGVKRFIKFYLVFVRVHNCGSWNDEVASCYNVPLYRGMHLSIL